MSRRKAKDVLGHAPARAREAGRKPRGAPDAAGGENGFVRDAGRAGRPESSARTGRSGAATQAARSVRASGGDLPSRSRTLLIGAGLVLAVFAVYSPVAHYGYLVFDDDVGLFKNPVVSSGLTGSGIAWAFRTLLLGNWIPLTWISHMLDFSLFGAQAGWHHLVNVLIHAANTVLLFALLIRWRRGTWPAAAAAALFALHPLRVESVAWLIERKDVLSALAWLGTIWFYVSYVQRGGARSRYLAALVVFTLGLAVKPMLVTLPFVLLLLDVWPLGRLAPNGRLVIEKLPFLAIAAISSAVALFAQRSMGAVRTFDQIPLATRVANALVAYAGYIMKTVWPAGLAVYYPYRLSIPSWQLLTAVLMLGAITAAAIATARRYPFVTVGWLWYLGTLVPVIGLVQLGGMAAADRYTYIPLIGLVIIAVELPLALAGGKLLLRRGLGAAAVVAVVVLAFLTWTQVQYWRSSVALFERALAVTSDNALAHYNLATALAQESRVDEAITQYRETLRIAPGFTDAHQNLALALFNQGKTDEAIEHYRAELSLNPNHPEAHCHLGVALAVKERYLEALAEFQAALRARPDYADAYYDMAVAYEKLSRPADAIAAYTKTLTLYPNNPDALFNLAMLNLRRGHGREAESQLAALLRLDPSYPQAAERLRALRAGREN